MVFTPPPLHPLILNTTNTLKCYYPYVYNKLHYKTLWPKMHRITTHLQEIPFWVTISPAVSQHILHGSWTCTHYLQVRSAGTDHAYTPLTHVEYKYSYFSHSINKNEMLTKKTHALKNPQCHQSRQNHHHETVCKFNQNSTTISWHWVGNTSWAMKSKS